MGKATDISSLERESRQKIAAPDVTICDCCTPVDAFSIKPNGGFEPTDSYEHKELVIIGAGPHALTLVLRLLEPSADLCSEKERHIKGDFHNRMRPYSQVRKHVQNLAQRPSAVYKQSKKSQNTSKNGTDPPPLTLDFVKENVLVVDASLSEDTEDGQTGGLYGWLAGWKMNFEALNIDQLRSPISAHADPFDHRSLEVFGALTGRESELIPLEHLPRQNGRWDFHGPYNAPSTDIFHDFHRQLITGYGVQNMVKPGMVETIRCDSVSGEFKLSIVDPRSGRTKIVQTPRVVCAVGPAYRKTEPLLRRMALDPWQLPHRVLRGNQIFDFLAACKNPDSSERQLANQSILIVGGGVTSAHLALTAANGCKCPWCESVVFIQRSALKERQFDLDEAWMGPARGKLLENFWSLSNEERASRLRDERGGGSIHPEVLRLLKKKSANFNGARTRLSVQEETEIVDVQYNYQKDKLVVAMDDGLPGKEFDMIWLATGFENHLDNYPFLDAIRRKMPVDIVEGLPVLNKDLSWKKSNGAVEEPYWTTNARSRFWMMGPLAGLELGPDALNLMGARHGSVRVAKAIRVDVCATTVGTTKHRD